MRGGGEEEEGGGLVEVEVESGLVADEGLGAEAGVEEGAGVEDEDEEEALRLEVDAIEVSSLSLSPLSPLPSLSLSFPSLCPPPVCICELPGPRDDELAFVAANRLTLDTSECACIWFPVCGNGNGTVVDNGVDPSLVEPIDFLDEVTFELEWLEWWVLELELEGMRGPTGVLISGEPGILSVVEMEGVDVEVKIDDGLWLCWPWC